MATVTKREAALCDRLLDALRLDPVTRDLTMPQVVDIAERLSGTELLTVLVALAERATASGPHAPRYEHTTGPKGIVR